MKRAATVLAQPCGLHPDPALSRGNSGHTFDPDSSLRFVVALINRHGQAEGPVCLPAPTRPRRIKNGLIRPEPFPVEAPLTWPTMCGLEGYVYLKAGPLEHAPVCEHCAAAPVPVELDDCGVYASMTRYNDGCRCRSCKRVSAEYRMRRYAAAGSPDRVCPGCGGLKAPAAVKCRRCKPRSAHGTTGRYAAGCRCDLCREARRVYHRNYMSQWRERRAA